MRRCDTCGWELNNKCYVHRTAWDMYCEKNGKMLDSRKEPCGSYVYRTEEERELAQKKAETERWLQSIKWT